MALFIDHLKEVLRRLSRAPLFTAIILVTLAVGIGANTVVFSVLEGVLLKPLNYPQSDRLIGIWHTAPGVGIPDLNIGQFEYFVYREQNTTFEDVGAYRADSFSVKIGAQPNHLDGISVTDGTLPLLRVKPALGRLFTHQDDTPNAPQTVILSWGYWKQRFGGDKNIVGRAIVIDGTAHEIIGVLPRGFQFLDERDAAIYVPFQWDRGKVKLLNFSYNALARLKPGVTLDQASTDIARMIPISMNSFPPPEGFNVKMFESARLGPNLRSLKKVVVGDIGNVLWILMGSLALVLLVACANVANLLLVRVEGRRQELAVRSALGAGRRQIALSLLLESLVLSVAGALLALGLSFIALKILIAAAPPALPRLHEISLSLPVLLFTFGAAVFVALVVSIVPVLKYSGVRAHTGLREGGRTLSESRDRHRARQALVAIQVALALVLLICSGLMIRTFRAIMRVDLGFTDPASLEKFDVYVPETEIPTSQNERVVRTDQAIADRLAAIPGVTRVTLATAIPLDGSINTNPVAAADHAYKEGELPPLRQFRYIAPGYFATLGTPLVAGRDITWDEEFHKRPVAIVTENFAREYWGSAQNAVGKRVREASNEDWREVIGVARDTYNDGPSKPAPTAAYWPLYQDNFNGNSKEMMRRDVSFLIRSPRAGSAAFRSEIQSAVWSIDPNLPLVGEQTVGELYKHSMERTSFTLVILCVAGAMALLLGIVGIYGVISFSVSQRTRDIGIRMALGARRETLVAMFVRQGLILTSIGVAAGLVIAFLTLRIMVSVLFGVSPADPWTYTTATVAILAIAWLACYVPSRRASVVNPVDALRAE